MDAKLFDRLVGSMQQMDEIVRGERAPSREFNPIGCQVLEALGMRPNKCAGFTIEFKPNEVVVVRAEYHTDQGEIEKVIRVLDGWRK